MSRRVVNVLHLASFTGNIGDNANHLGTRAQFSENLSFEFKYTPLEIREFYWGRRYFDQSFIDYVNSFELLIVGGGNYFELWVEKSRTGCSIDLPVEHLKKISTPILFYGLGVDAGQGVPKQCQQRFGEFLSHLIETPSIMTVVRNDGAKETLQKYFPAIDARSILKVPDGGFFIRPSQHEHCELKLGKNIAINIAGDMLDTRFPQTENYRFDDFCREFAKTLTEKLELDQSLNLVFIPHIFRDLDAIHQVLLQLDDEIRRTRISVAPYLTGNLGAEKLFSLYQQCDLSLAMRFHANVCPLGMGKPVLGLCNYPQIDNLYRDLDISESCVWVNREGFSADLVRKIDEVLVEGQESTHALQEKVKADCQSTHAEINQWLSTVL